jgi:hypothetical protein
MSIPPFHWGKKNSCHSNVMLSRVVYEITRCHFYFVSTR